MGENTAKKKRLLSISLLASNRKKTIRKCLDSIQPLLECLDSELIIVDTGCDEETHNILLEYTDQIVSFEWCKDFSKARNAGLELAQGEWFLYLDDDEWFIDVDEILEFFQSGEYRKYALACYIQRNYSDHQESSYQDAWVSRMMRRDADTRFISSIHEFLYPVKGECKLLHSAVKHFGYVFDTEKERYQHAERNVSLLLDMIKKERGNMRWWTHLLQEYVGLKEHQKLLETCNEALEIIKDADQPMINKDRGSFYIGRLMAEMHTHQREKAVSDFEEAIRDERNTEICCAKLYNYGAQIYFELERYAESEKCCKAYLTLYDKYGGNERACFEQGAIFIRDVFGKMELNTIYSICIINGLLRKNTDILKEYFDFIGWKEEKLYVYGSIVARLIDAMGTMDYEEYFVHVADTIINRKGPDQEAIQAIQKKESGSPEEFLKLIRIFSQVESSDYYIQYLKIRNADITETTDNLNDYYSALLKGVVDILRLNDSVWDIAKKYAVDLDKYISQIKFDVWKKGVDSFCEKTTIEEIQKRWDLVNSIRKSNNIRYQYFFLKSMEARIVYGDGKEEYDLLRALLYEFSEQSILFYSQYYKQTAFCGEMELLPESCRAAVCIKKALEEEETGDYKKVLVSLKNCLNIFPSFNNAIRNYSHLYGEKVKAESISRGISEEMKQLTEEYTVNVSAEYLDIMDYLKLADELLELTHEELVQIDFNNVDELQTVFREYAGNNTAVLEEKYKKVTEVRLDKEQYYRKFHDWLEYCKTICAFQLGSALKNSTETDLESMKKICAYVEKNTMVVPSKAYVLSCVAATQRKQNPEYAYQLYRKSFQMFPKLGEMYGSDYVYDEKAIEETYYENCPICGHDHSEVYYCAPQFLRLHGISCFAPVKLWKKCSKCNNIFAYNFPVLKMGEINGHFTVSASYSTIYPRYGLRIYSDILNKCRTYTSGKKYLDVGIGAGEMLAAALEMGYEAEGCEICKEDCEKVASVLGIKIQWADFLKFESTKKYDVITMGDIIEHVSSPIEALRKAESLLAQDGVLWLSTPNYESAFSRLQKFEDPMWLQEDHLTYFSYQGLLPFLDELNLKVVHYDISNRYNGSMELFCVKRQA